MQKIKVGDLIGYSDLLAPKGKDAMVLGLVLARHPRRTHLMKVIWFDDYVVSEEMEEIDTSDNGLEKYSIVSESPGSSVG